MKLRSVLLGACVALGGCALSPPPAPNVPPLPKGPVTPPPPPVLAVNDVEMLQKISTKTAYMKALAATASSRTDDSLIKNFAAQLEADCDKAHKAAQTLAGTYHLSVVETLSQPQKARLATLNRLYGKPFDRLFLNSLIRSSTVSEKNQLILLQKNSGNADMKALAQSVLTLLERAHTQGQGLQHR